jgi:hypothetical protein
MAYTIINKTPHPVHIVDAAGNIVRTFPKSDTLIRLKSAVRPLANFDGVPVTETIFGEPEGLPAYESGIYYIVSQLVKAALPDRFDLLVPAEMLRDKEGNIIGCQSLGA